ncbi:hypothetical protein [Cohnella sp. GbtcB17]|uniref:hypothetical protein n=1 Tax=Cohnella sp. GbtcB17 TaxID=2824762 RepID=UPI001C2FE9ED|nr:hypothetical protein [Cohnella sp. GbtcB17]
MNLTWNPLWVNPFESPWSIIEKIKYSNAITARDLIRKYGTRSSGGKLVNQWNGLLKFNGIDHSLLSQSIGTDYSKHSELYLNKMVGMFPESGTDYLINKELYFCDDCLSMGYHSLLHQFVFATKCPFHLSPLRNTCRNCGNSPSCDRHDHYSKAGFQCSCSNYYTKPKFTSMSDWQLDLTINDEIITKWISMDSSTFNRIKNSYFFIPSLITMSNPLQFIIRFGTRNDAEMCIGSDC